MKTQTRLSRHNKFISAENITILSVLSDDYLHASLSLQSSERLHIGYSATTEKHVNSHLTRRRVFLRRNKFIMTT